MEEGNEVCTTLSEQHSGVWTGAALCGIDSVSYTHLDTPEREEEILRSNLNDLEIRLSELNKKRDSLIDENGDLLNGILAF